MARSLLALAVSSVLLVSVTPALAGGCAGCSKVAKVGEGFCCGKGKIYGVKLSSKKLYAALAGHKIDDEAIKCAGCKAAAKSNGRCEHCGVGAADGKLFHSKPSHALAKGTVVSAAKAAHCDACLLAFKINGYCSGCDSGFVAGRMFKGKEEYKAALAAHKTLVDASAASKKCEACAVAMVTDGKCEQCNVSFKDGRSEG